MGIILTLYISSAVKISLNIRSHAVPALMVIKFRQMYKSEGNVWKWAMGKGWGKGRNLGYTVAINTSSVKGYLMNLAFADF